MRAVRFSTSEAFLVAAAADATCFTPAGGTQDFWEVFERDEYEPGTVKRMRKLLRPGSLFVDVGAWIGPFTLLAMSLGARVLAFEPDPVAYEALIANVIANHPVGQAHAQAVAINAAVVPEGDTFPYGLAEADGKGLSRLGTEGRVVNRITLQQADIFGGLGPSFVKIDVEGFEVKLMPSLGPYLASKKVAVQVSLHGERFPAAALNGYPTVIWPQGDHGDVVALPYVAMDAKAWT